MIPFIDLIKNKTPKIYLGFLQKTVGADSKLRS